MSMEECLLAETGVSLSVILVAALALVIISGMFMLPSVRRKLGLLVLPAALVLGTTSFALIPVEAGAQAVDPCVVLADPDESTGLQGEVQVHNVLQNDSPSEGATFVLSSLVLGLVDSPVPGSVLSADRKTVTVPGEGTYQVNDNGTITFTPEPDFLGRASGVRYSIRDTNGLTAHSTYTPTVVGDIGAIEPPVAVNDVLQTVCVSAHDNEDSGFNFFVDWTTCNSIVGVQGGTLYGTTFTVSLLGNDEASAGADLATVDLDPATPGIQHTYDYTIPGSGGGADLPVFTATYNPATGELTVEVHDPYVYYQYLASEADGIVLDYTFRDLEGQQSNVAHVLHEVIDGIHMPA